MKTPSLNYKKANIKPVWCPGCGDYAVFSALQKSFGELELKPEETVIVSGIGCSGRVSHYFNTYSLHGTHGRAVPTATGVKTVRPDLTVLCVGGDGDGLSIGGGHIAPAARKNIDITYLLLDNSIYGLTKGQVSPTTPETYTTKTTPYGPLEENIEALPIFLAYDISFVARVNALNMKQMVSVITAAIRHKGMSIVYIISPCVTYPAMPWNSLKEGWEEIPEDHPQDDKMKSLELAYCKSPLYTGIFYDVERPTIGERLDQAKERGLKKNSKEGDLLTVETLLKDFY
jgi:2-oxoglutarate ferredoxin oxidoreductase subunit beta